MAHFQTPFCDIMWNMLAFFFLGLTSFVWPEADDAAINEIIVLDEVFSDINIWFRFHSTVKEYNS